MKIVGSAIAVLLLVGLLCTPAQAGSVVASLSGSPVTIQAGSTGTLTLTFVVSGSTNPNRQPAIGYCETVTLKADGTLACTAGSLLLTPGQNFTVKGQPTTFTRTVSLVVNADVPCGRSYNGSMLLWSGEGTGLDFGALGLQVIVYFTVDVTCPASVDPAGCSHGYWKNHQADWPAGYSDKSLSDVFTLPGDFSALGGDSLMTALNYNGGRGLLDKGKLLLLQAAAAVLNANALPGSYPYTESQIQTLVYNALNSGNGDAILALKDDLDAKNNLYCPF